MIHKLVDESHEGVSDEQTVNGDNLLGVMNDVADNLGTGGVIRCGSLVNEGELSGLSVLNRSDKMLVEGDILVIKEGHNLATEDLQKQK
jgi:hypothetical protein